METLSPEIVSNILCYLNTFDMESLALASKSLFSFILSNTIYVQRVKSFIEKLRIQLLYLEKKIGTAGRFFSNEHMFQKLCRRYGSLRKYYDCFLSTPQPFFMAFNGTVQIPLRLLFSHDGKIKEATSSMKISG